MNITQVCEKLQLETPRVLGNQAVVDISRERFADACTMASKDCELPLSLLFATDERKTSTSFFVHAVFFVSNDRAFLTLKTRVPADDATYHSLTKTIPAAHWYERLTSDMFGIIPVGHPDFRRLVHHENIPSGTHPLRKDFAWNAKLPWADEPYPMHRVDGKGIYEIPVGPIHAGIIEPGHFRFHVQGERIITLEGKLFFTHKGVEKLLEGKTPVCAMPFVERISGDAAVSHALAFAQAIEQICAVDVPERALQIRVVLNEMERLAQHVFDIANMGGNGTGFTFMGAQGFRIYEHVRRMCEKLTGHRYLRGAIVPGGVTKDISPAMNEELATFLKTIREDLQEVIAVGEAKDSMRERLDGTGVLSKEAALAYGAVGLAARASGIARDVRRDLPYAVYGSLNVHVMHEAGGDIRARYVMRVREADETFRILFTVLKKLSDGPLSTAVHYGAGESLGAAESWRGEIIDFVRLSADGTIDRAVIRDPSFCNWPLFGEIGPGNIIPDFPICNKSLNLSYSGCDL